jgi:hypothetical protein
MVYSDDDCKTNLDKSIALVVSLDVEKSTVDNQDV